jgi:hypothetical protein
MGTADPGAFDQDRIATSENVPKMLFSHGLIHHTGEKLKDPGYPFGLLLC